MPSAFKVFETCAHFVRKEGDFLYTPVDSPFPDHPDKENRKKSTEGSRRRKKSSVESVVKQLAHRVRKSEAETVEKRLLPENYPFTEVGGDQRPLSSAGRDPEHKSPHLHVGGKPGILLR